MQEYNTAKQFYEHEFRLFASPFLFQFDFQSEQIVVLVQGSMECANKVIDDEFDKGLRKVDQFQEFDVYIYNRMDKNQTDFDETDQIIDRFIHNHTCTNVQIIKLLDSKFG